MATMVKSMALEGIEGFPVEIEAATIRASSRWSPSSVWETRR